MASKDIRQLSRQLRHQGWRVTATNGDHLRFEGPEGQLVFGPATPSDHRAIRNLVAKLRREGANL
jgi:predicted RNA binding protein YcfA (HicA-like mRNA interferase family)